jgi:hypothetical protein
MMHKLAVKESLDRKFKRLLVTLLDFDHHDNICRT